MERQTMMSRNHGPATKSAMLISRIAKGAGVTAVAIVAAGVFAIPASSAWCDPQSTTCLYRNAVPAATATTTVVEPSIEEPVAQAETPRGVCDGTGAGYGYGDGTGTGVCDGTSYGQNRGGAGVGQGAGYGHHGYGRHAGACR